MKILILNGPNLNMLGRREPEIYGNMPFDMILASLRGRFPEVNLLYSQSNHEGDLIDLIQAAPDDPECIGIVLNAGAYTHTSLALADAIAAIKPLPVVEVHLSNTASREPIRRQSLIAPQCRGSVTGFGALSYDLAIRALLNIASPDDDN